VRPAAAVVQDVGPDGPVGFAFEQAVERFLFTGALRLSESLEVDPLLAVVLDADLFLLRVE